MSLAERLLSHLEGVRRTGPDRWMARCPAHDDRTASLSVRESPNGNVLLNCFAGCPYDEVLAAIGLDASALFERSDPYHTPHRERRPWPASDVLRCVAYEATVAAVGAAAVADGRKITRADRERLVVAAARLREAARIAGVSHG